MVEGATFSPWELDAIRDKLLPVRFSDAAFEKLNPGSRAWVGIRLPLNFRFHRVSNDYPQHFSHVKFRIKLARIHLPGSQGAGQALSNRL
jgi:hypothetical protein